MPGNVSNTDAAAVRELLLSRRAELQTRERRVARDLSRKNEALAQDFADRAVQLQNDEPLNAIGAAAQAELDGIERALERLNRGLYGICAICQEPIETQRLRLVPYAVTCSRCSYG